MGFGIDLGLRMGSGFLTGERIGILENVRVGSSGFRWVCLDLIFGFADLGKMGKGSEIEVSQRCRETRIDRDYSVGSSL